MFKRYLKGASHEIEMGRIWYQKKGLEKLEVRGYFIMSVDAHARSYERLSSPAVFIWPSNLTQTLRKTANKFVGGLPKPVKI